VLVMADSVMQQTQKILSELLMGEIRQKRVILHWFECVNQF
jgi:hypothetical protein